MAEITMTAKRLLIEVQHKCIDDVPNEILQKNVFKRYFAAWERLILEFVCKQWKQLMPYNDSYLDMFCACRGMSEIMHYFRQQCSANPLVANNVDFMRKCMNHLLAGRNMGAHVKTLIMKDPSTSYPSLGLFFDPALAQLIIDFCSKVEHFQLENVKCEPETLQMLAAKMNLENLESLLIDTQSKRNFKSAALQMAGLNLILRRATQLKELSVSLGDFRFEPQPWNQSLVRLSLKKCEISQQFIDALPVGCPGLQEIELFDMHLNWPRLSPALRNLADLSRICIHYESYVEMNQANVLTDDLYAISQYFTAIRKRPLESIRFVSIPSITSVDSLNRLWRIKELVVLETSILWIRQDEFDAAFRNFCCAKMEELSLHRLYQASESELLTTLGVVAGNSLRKLRISHLGEHWNENCWQDFIQNCELLAELVLETTRINVEVFSNLGRSRSLQKISIGRYATAGPATEPILTADHWRKLAETRITENLQQQWLTVHCNDQLFFPNENFPQPEELLAAGIEMKLF